MKGLLHWICVRLGQCPWLTLEERKDWLRRAIRLSAELDGE